MRATLARWFGKLIVAGCVLSFAAFSAVQADDGVWVALTNVNQLVTVFANPPGGIPFVLPLDTAPTNDFPQWWVRTADPFWPMTRGVPIWWTDFGSMPTNFTALRDYQSTTNASGIQLWPLKLVRFEDTGAVSVQVPGDGTELLSVSPSSSYEPDGQYEWILWEWNVLGIFQNKQPYDELVAQYPDLAPQRLILPLWIADINDMPVCETTTGVSPSGMFMMSEEDDGGGDGGGGSSSSCNVTNLTQPFLITSIGLATNRYITITWQSCPIFRYIVFSADLLGTNTSWLTRAYVWGQVNASATSWTDTTTASTNVTQRFYRVKRILGSSIGAGEFHSLAVTPDGNLWAWGWNSDGELGDGTTTDQVVPADVVPNVTSCFGQAVSNAVAVASGGEEFIVVADATGTVWTAGGNDDGQLGRGEAGASIDELSIAPVAGISNMVSVAAGYLHTLALRSDGTVWAWGDDESGQLGDNGLATASSCQCTNSPVQSQGLTNVVVVAIAAGFEHSAALDQDGNVWTWGANDSGQLGNGGTNPTNVPVMLTTISNVIAIAAGSLHTIALASNKTVWTWGDNSGTQLGRDIGTLTYDPLPGRVTTLSNVVAIAGGQLFSVAVVSNGQVYAWGDNSLGQLGTNRSDVASTNLPMLVTGMSNAVLVSAPPLDLFGDSQPGGHSVAMTVDQGTNHYWGWGDNFFGQVGNGTNSANNGGSDDQYTPVQVQFCTRCQRNVQLGTSGSFTAECNGTLYLYFNDQIGQFGDNGTNSYAVTFHAVGQTNVLATVMGANGNGVAVATVTNGGVYAYDASGFCARNNFNQLTDADGRDPNSNQVACSSINITNSICPAAHCFSLVGKIQ